MCYNKRIKARQPREGGESRLMKIVDLRSTLTNSNDVLIQIDGVHIYYAEEKIIEGKRNLFLLDYDRSTREERVLSDHCLLNPRYVMHYFSFPEHILVVMEDGGSEAWFLRVEKSGGGEEILQPVYFAGNYAACCALDCRHVLLYSTENPRDATLFREYRRQTGFTRAAYLCDVQTGQCWSVQDPRVCAGAGLLPYTGGGEQKLLVLQPYGTEEEKRKAYRDRRWLSGSVTDQIWICALPAFIDAVEAGQACAPMQRVLRAGTEGMVRFAAQDTNSLYFRALYFPHDDQRILAVNKHTGAKREAARLNLAPDEKDARFVIDPEGRAYKMTALDSRHMRVQGLLNSTADLSFDTNLGKFFACFDDRYLLLRDEIRDETDSIVFYTLVDAKSGKAKNFEGSCAFQGDVLVVF